MSAPLITVFLLAAASVVLLAGLMATAFVRIATVLSIIRIAVGLPTIPPATVVAGLSIILTFFVMAPVGEKVLERSGPLLQSMENGEHATVEDIKGMMKQASGAMEPLVDFLRKRADSSEVEYFHASAAGLGGTEAKKDSLRVLLPAFVIGELKQAFRIGFLIFIPFIIIDLVVVNIIFAIGLHTLQPASVAIPLKLLLFILADGWHLIAGGLVRGFVV